LSGFRAGSSAEHQRIHLVGLAASRCWIAIERMCVPVPSSFCILCAKVATATATAAGGVVVMVLVCHAKDQRANALRHTSTNTSAKLKHLQACTHSTHPLKTL